ncbi:Membrane transport protein [Arabidopsis thaliana x Arabidopsis arenosa]|nr:Membrane transport protein [Arabidopsis thaliana x Arabidopsis arenosa]
MLLGNSESFSINQRIRRSISLFLSILRSFYSMTMRLLDLFITSSIPVAKILLITGIGFYLALDQVNILNHDARKQLNNIVFYVFSPSLVASSLSETITYESMVKMWFMPLNVLLTFIIGSFLGWIVIKITKPPSHLRGIIVGCCAAGNLGNMPLIIIPAICNEKGSPFGDPESCEKFGLGYIALSMAIGAIYIWTYVYNLMRMLANPAGETAINSTSSTMPLISPKVEVAEQVGTWGKVKQRVCSVAEKINLRTIFAPSTIAALIALAVGLNPLLRKLLVGNTAPLRVIEDSVSLLGDGAIPVLTLIVGGNLLNGLRGSGINKSVIMGVVVVRYLLLPILGVFIVRGAHYLGLVTSEPLYQFVLLLQYVVPPAMNLGTITQLFGSGESECSVILFWSYALASVSLTVWPTFFMWLVA